MAQPRVLSAFSGAGGLDIGLEAAGFSTVACIEVDATARRTICLNRPEWQLLDPPDIVGVAKAGIARMLPAGVDVLAGGPPCQPFSRAAEWVATGTAGLDDPRSSALIAFFRLARDLLPKVILIENVPGFVRGRTSALPFVKSVIRRINRDTGSRYRLTWAVLDAADYGVPQHRTRAILILHRTGQAFDWPTPTHADSPLTAWDALSDVSPVEPPRPTGRWTHLLPSIPEGSNYLWHTAQGGGTPLFGYRTRYWSFLLKLAKGRPSWTIPAQPGSSTGPFHWDNRPLSVEEALRLQGFPDEWQFAGGRTAKMRQIGNATPPLLAEVIGREILRQFFDSPPEGEPCLIGSRASIDPPPGVVTMMDCPLPADPVAAHPGSGLGPSPRLRIGQRVQGRFATRAAVNRLATPSPDPGTTE